MNGQTAFDRAREDLVFAHERKTSLSDPFLAALPVTGASVSVLSERIGQTTISASDATAVRLDEIQFDIGEGPCWHALMSRRPVLEPRIRIGERSNWPHFLEALRSDNIGGAVEAMFAFPLAIGVLNIGAVDLWSSSAEPLSPRHVEEASALAELASWQVLRRVLGGLPELADESESIGSRREIHQATGMVLAQLDITAADASLVLRAHAFAQGMSLGAIANDVVQRRLVFTPDDIFGSKDPGV